MRRAQRRDPFPEDDNFGKKSDGADWLGANKKSTNNSASQKKPEKNEPEKNPLKKIKESGAKATDIAKRILLTDEREIQVGLV